MSDFAYSLEGKRVWVAGHTGLVGSATAHRLESEGPAEIITISHGDLDLRRQADTERFIADTRPDTIVIAAARVGGIHANRSAQGQFLYDNVMIASNIIEAARVTGVERILTLGSSCIYPREAPQPMREDAFLTGPLEPTNEGYAVAKIVTLELGKMYRRQYGMSVISLMPTNLYGPRDSFDLKTSHVLPALLRKVHDAKVRGDTTVPVWGSGRPRREFMHVDDMADAAVFALRNYDGESHLNVGTGTDVTIREVTELVAQAVGWDGELEFDTSMPDGMPRKLLDVSAMSSLGWSAQITLEDGLRSTYAWYLEHAAS